MDEHSNPENGVPECLTRAPGSTPPTIHASCVALGEAGVLLTGVSGSGKSDLLLRLMEAGFALVADDRVILVDGSAQPPEALAGLVEIRGLGIVRLPWCGAPVRVRLHVALGEGGGERLPAPARHEPTGALSIRLDPRRAGAVAVIRVALGCALGDVDMVAGVNDATGAASA